MVVEVKDGEKTRRDGTFHWVWFYVQHLSPLLDIPRAFPSQAREVSVPAALPAIHTNASSIPRAHKEVQRIAKAVQMLQVNS